MQKFLFWEDWEVDLFKSGLCHSCLIEFMHHCYQEDFTQLWATLHHLGTKKNRYLSIFIFMKYIKYFQQVIIKHCCNSAKVYNYEYIKSDTDCSYGYFCWFYPYQPIKLSRVYAHLKHKNHAINVSGSIFFLHDIPGLIFSYYVMTHD